MDTNKPIEPEFGIPAGENRIDKPEAQMPRLVLSMNPNGSLNIEGPVQDKLLCYGLLEWAKETICEFHRKKPKDNGHGIINFARRFK